MKKHTPDAKRKVKMTEKTLPRITETAELAYSLTLITASPKETEEAGGKGCKE